MPLVDSNALTRTPAQHPHMRSAAASLADHLSPRSRPGFPVKSPERQVAATQLCVLDCLQRSL
jgi:hypothetical protein